MFINERMPPHQTNEMFRCPRLSFDVDNHLGPFSERPDRRFCRPKRNWRCLTGNHLKH